MGGRAAGVSSLLTRQHAWKILIAPPIESRCGRRSLNGTAPEHLRHCRTFRFRRDHPERWHALQPMHPLRGRPYRGEGPLGRPAAGSPGRVEKRQSAQAEPPTPSPADMPAETDDTILILGKPYGRRSAHCLERQGLEVASIRREMQRGERRKLLQKWQALSRD